MRIVVLVTLLAAVQVAAQDACDAENPCPLVVNLTNEGFEAPDSWNVTRGDWYYLSVANFSDHAVNVTLERHAVRLTVESLDVADSPPFQFAQAGRFLVQDGRGHTATVVVLAGDVVDEEQGVAANSTSQTSALPVAVGLLALALAARRR